MGFSRQEYWSGLPHSSSGDLPEPRMNLHLLCVVRWQMSSSPLTPRRKPPPQINHHQKIYKQEMLERVWREGKPPTLLEGICVDPATGAEYGASSIPLSPCHVQALRPRGERQRSHSPAPAISKLYICTAQHCSHQLRVAGAMLSVTFYLISVNKTLKLKLWKIFSTKHNFTVLVRLFDIYFT